MIKKFFTLLCLCCIVIGNAWGADVIDNAATKNSLGNTGTSTWATFSITCNSGAQFTIRSMGTKGNTNALQWNANGYLYQTKSGGKLKSVTIKGASKAVNIFASNVAYTEKAPGNALKSLTASADGTTYTFQDEYTFLAINGTTSSTAIESITIEYDNGPAKTQAYLRWENSGDQEYFLGQNFSNVAKLYDAETGGNEITGQEITYSSSNEEYATVDENGNVSPKKAGDVTITASLTSDTYKANEISYKATAKYKYSTPTYTASVVEGSRDGNKFIGKMKVEFEINDNDDVKPTQIRYTINGDDPTTSSTLYTEPIIIEKTTTIKAISCDEEGFCSGIKSVTLTKVPVYTVTLSDNETELTSNFDGKVTLPKRLSADNEYNIFAGWAKAAINEATATAPELFNGEYTPAGDITLYPIFKKETQGEIGWTEVTDLSKITAGTYAIITTDGHAFNGTISSGHGQVTSDAFSFTNGSATSAPEGTCEITLTASGNGFTMYNADKGYLYAKAAKSGNLAWHSQEDSYWSYKKSNWIYENNQAYLRSYNNTSFRTYDSSNGKDLIFAKKGATIISEFKTVNSELEYTRELTVGKYATMCLPCSANISGAEVYSVEGVDSKLTPTILYLTKIEGETVAGVPYIIRATGNKLVASYTGEPTEDAGNEKGLYGSFISAPIEAGKLNYILKDNTWHYIPAGNTNTVGAYKAYLNLNDVEVKSSGAKGDFEMVFDGNVTSINLVPTTEEMGGAMYNLNGMQVNSSYKGIVVKNGKKFINK